MMHGAFNPGVAGSELTHLLARLADIPAPQGRAAFAERLGHWLGWTGAISLSAALKGAVGETAAGAVDACGSENADFQRVRATLEASIAAGPKPTMVSPSDFAPHRRHCAAQQQAMQDAVGALRRRLRDTLSRRSAEGSRLAAIDAAMDHALAARERSLLGLVPLRLQAHFERMHRASGDAPHWLAAFQEDTTHLLRAELAHRLLPARGLLDTLSLHAGPPASPIRHAPP